MGSATAPAAADRNSTLTRMDEAVPSHGMGLSSRVGHIITALLIVMAMLIAAWGAGAFGGPSVQDFAGGWLGPDGTWVAPATAAFRIWSVIYLGIIVYAVWQFLPAAQTARHDGLRGPVLIAVLLNSVWLLATRAGWLGLSVVVIVALLATLCWIIALLERRRHSSLSERIILDGVQGLYLGWVSVATVANVAAWLASIGWLGSPLLPTTWAVIVLCVAAVIGAFTAAYTGGRIGPALALAWGLAWIGVGRMDGSGLQSGTVAVTGFGAALIVLLCWAASLWLSSRSRTGEARDILFGGQEMIPADAEADAAAPGRRG